MKAADEFVSTEEVLERIKDILSTKIGNEKKIFDRDVAEFLGIEYQKLATAKSRNSSSLYKSILKMCARTGLDPIKLLF